MVLAHYHQARQFSVSAGTRLEREMLHPSDGGKGFLHRVVNFLNAFQSDFRLEGMQRGKCRHCCYLFVYLGIVLHSTASQRVEAGIDAEVHLREVGIVAYHVNLAYLRKQGGILPQKAFVNGIGSTVELSLRQAEAAASFLGELEYEFIVVFHALTSFITSIIASISSLVRFSVTQKVT